MKNSEVTLGGTYLAKVTDKVVPVRIDATNPHGGWDATNMATNKKVRIKSAQRLRGPAPAPGSRQAQQRTRAVAEARAADAAANAHAVPAETKASKAKKNAGEPKAKKVSGLDAAFEVLKAKGEPMSCQAIVEEMLSKGMWKTGGKTPAQTIYSALLRSIEKKAGESRFVKTGRGLFALAK